MLLRMFISALLALSFLAMPLEAWSTYDLGADTHDCVKVKRGKYKCVRGPLAGRTFKSQMAMIRALTKGAGPMLGDQKVVKTKKAVKKGVKKKFKAKRSRRR